MIAAWMLYCLLCTVGFSLAAALAERALLRGRNSIRLVWIGAVAISVLVPAIAFRFAQRSPVPETTAPSAAGAPIVQVESAPPSTAQTSANVPASPTVGGSTWRAQVAQLDDLLRIVWITLSIAVAFNFFGGIVVLRWMRRSWQKRSVLGVPVYISERTGPAVVGALSPAIVLPQWVLGLDPKQLELMLRHEQEHQRAGDGRLLTIAQLALVVLPWNVALWWQILRLRVAVELDCDARVLREADARTYGDLLLEVARPRRGPALLGVTAFAERAAQLERRIRLLARNRARANRGARAVASIIGAVALTAAWVAPRPPAPARTTPVAATPTNRPAPAPLPTLAAIFPNTSTPVDKPVTSVQRASVTKKAIPLPEKPAPCGAASTREAPRLADQAFDVLFAGIKLSTTQAARACELLLGLQDEQARQDVVSATTIQVQRARRSALEAQRDSALRALLTNDADRAAFEEHRAAPAGFARGGGAGRGAGLGAGRGGATAEITARGGVVYDSLLQGRAAGRGARSGGAGGGLGGARLGGGGAPTAELATLMTDMTYRRLFNGISLTTEQETIARALISNTQQETMQLQMPMMVTVLRLNPAQDAVTMTEESATALSDLLSSEADRALLQERIMKVFAR